MCSRCPWGSFDLSLQNIMLGNFYFCILPASCKCPILHQLVQMELLRLFQVQILNHDLCWVHLHINMNSTSFQSPLVVLFAGSHENFGNTNWLCWQRVSQLKCLPVVNLRSQTTRQLLGKQMNRLERNKKRKTVVGLCKKLPKGGVLHNYVIGQHRLGL